MEREGEGEGVEMSREHILRCDKCKRELFNELDGLAIQGNIYRIDVNNEFGMGGGLVGNNFPIQTKKEGTKDLFSIEGVKVKHYCNNCFKKIADER